MFINFLIFNYLFCILLFSFYISIVWRNDRLVINSYLHRFIVFYFYLSLTGLPTLFIFFIKLHLLNLLISKMYLYILIFFLLNNIYFFYYYYLNFNYFNNMKWKRNNYFQMLYSNYNLYSIIFIIIVHFLLNFLSIIYLIIFI